MPLAGAVRCRVGSFSGQAALLVQLELGKSRSGRTWQQAGLDPLRLTVNVQQEALGLQMSRGVACPGDLPWSGLQTPREGKGQRQNCVGACASLVPTACACCRY